MSNPIRDPVTGLACAKRSPYIFRRLLVADGFQNRRLDLVRCVLKFQMPQHHGGREDRAEGIRLVFAGYWRSRAVDGFKH